MKKIAEIITKDLTLEMFQKAVQEELEKFADEIIEKKVAEFKAKLVGQKVQLIASMVEKISVESTTQGMINILVRM